MPPASPVSLAQRGPLVLAFLGLGLGALAWAARPVSQNDGGASRVTTVGGGATADSNNDMIAVTGVDVTGVSVLYLIDTKSKKLAVYQASGGSGGTQGIKLVGARNIALDLQLDGFNDKTEYKGRPLRFQDLQKRFEGSGLTVDGSSEEE
ncbi:MAG: hypothetical protein R3F33_16285 [Planctomycetota bacterium]